MNIIYIVYATIEKELPLVNIFFKKNKKIKIIAFVPHYQLHSSDTQLSDLSFKNIQHRTLN